MIREDAVLTPEALGRAIPYAQDGFSSQHMVIGSDAILNTDMSAPPQTNVVRVLRDANLSSIGKPDYLHVQD